MRIKTLFVKNVFYKILHFILLIITVTLFIISVVSFIWTGIKSNNIYIDLSNTEINNFYQNYKFAIYLFGSFITVLTLVITIEKMNQTRKQIIIASNNNKFTNYYKHQEFFHDHLTKSEVFSILKKYSDWNVDHLSKLFYSNLYVNNYKNFKAKLSDSGKTRISFFLDNLRNNKINHDIIDKRLDDDELIDIYNGIKKIVGCFTGNTVTNLLKIKPEWKDIVNTKEEPWELTFLRTFVGLYISYRVYIEILSFEGEDIIKHTCFGLLYNSKYIFELYKLDELLTPSLTKLEP